jgi:glucosamine-6-phosphate deaminase
MENMESSPKDQDAADACVQTKLCGRLKVIVSRDSKELAARAARDGAELIRRAVAERGRASIILATGASQFDMLSCLVAEPEIPWHRITAFHLDEYAGLPITHPASFRLYLWQRFVSRLPTPLAAFHFINATDDPATECRRLGEVIRRHAIDVAFVGIGENGHLAFNDPPADFETDEPYLVATLDEACRRQQVGEGWFRSFDEVPRQAISMSCRQICKSQAVICTVPDVRKAPAVKACLEGPVSPMAPASILQEHPDATIYLDPPSASLLSF